MTLDDITKYAKHGTEPDGLNVAETVLWCRLKDIYTDFKTGKIGKEDGERRKAQALAEYEEAAAAVEQYRQYVLHTAEMWTQVESAAIAYAKAEQHTPEADALMEAIYGVKFQWQE